MQLSEVKRKASCGFFLLLLFSLRVGDKSINVQKFTAISDVIENCLRFQDRGYVWLSDNVFFFFLKSFQFIWCV
jgi:hypothetical protein